MANKYILDTHALVWYLEGNPKLGQQAKITMDAADSLAQLLKVCKTGRIENYGIPNH